MISTLALILLAQADAGPVSPSGVEGSLRSANSDSSRKPSSLDSARDRLGQNGGSISVSANPQDGGTDHAVDVVSGASVKGTIDAEAAVDLLAANVVSDEPGSGTPAELTAFELGLRARLYATAFSRHAHVDFDYQGRQPIAGTSQNSAIHLIYKAEVSFDFLDKLLFLGVGRFLAPSAGLLPVDGLRAQLHLSQFIFQVFGGRRAITSTRTGNVDLTTFLPAAGASVSFAMPRVQAELAGTLSRDQVPLGTTTQSFDAFSLSARAVGRPFDWLVLGAELSTAQRASYVLGPTWNSVELTARTVDLFSAVAFAEVRPLKTLRVAYDFRFQQAGLYREGIRLSPDDPQVTADGFTPRFIDNRLRVKWRPMGLGWLGPEVRFRIRPDRQEWRFGGFADLAPDWAHGFCLRGNYTYEKMVQTGAELAPDRSYWSASVGWRGLGLDVAAGASDVQRSVLPLSSRTYTPYDDGPNKAVDLSPFVLASQRIAFVRAFYGTGIWFAGLDFEQSLTDGRERRFFLQLGARLEKEW
jgi:hypothetical protein